MADAAVSFGVVVAGGLILLTGWNWLDPTASLPGNPASMSVKPSCPSIRKAFAIPIGTTCTPLITRFTPMAELLAPFTVQTHKAACLFWHKATSRALNRASAW